MIKNEEMNKSIGRSIAISLINYLDDNRYEGAMNMSSIECEDLEKSIFDLDWGKVYRYMQKKLEKQGKQKPSEWSEEDSEWYMVVKESILERWKGTDNKDLIEIMDGALEWLKSIKERMKGE